ncbi:MAG: hypothetical protein RLY82_973 [Pseudomonadota bacterium]|jgi:membrane-associated phospholipid phosphatase
MTISAMTWNQSLFLWLNHACAALPDWIWASLTITGHTSMVFALFGAFLLPGFKRPTIITALFATAIVGGIVSTALKESFKIMRPPAVLAPEQFHLIGHKLELVSFPSGHTLTAFAVAALLIFGLSLRGWRLLGVLALACAIGLSRVAVGAHWPLDVAGGAALGFACGWLGGLAGKSIHRQAWADSRLYGFIQIAIILLVSASLFATQMGYSDALIWQITTGVIGMTFSTYSLLLLLKFSNTR